MKFADTSMARAMRVEGISPSQRLVLLKLAEFEDVWGTAAPSVDRMCNELGMGRSTIYRCLAALEKLGLVVRKIVDTFKTTVYELILGGPATGHGKSPKGPKSGLSSKKSKSRGPKSGPNHSHSYVASSDKSFSPSGKRAARPSGRAAQEVESQTPVDIVTIGYPKRKERVMAPTPGFEDSAQSQEWAPIQKVRLGRPPADEDVVGAVGRLTEPQSQEKPEKPVDRWNARDLQEYLSGKCRKAAPKAREQVQVGWARGDFRKWLDQGTSAQTLKTTIDWFFADERNLLEIGRGLTLWQRYRVFFIQNQARASEAEPVSPHVDEERSIEEQRAARDAELARRYPELFAGVSR